MSNDRFEQLSEADKQGPQESTKESENSAASADSTTSHDNQSAEATNETTESQPNNTVPDEDEAEDQNPKDSPAFEFSPDLGTTLYFRDDSWSEFKRAYNMKGLPQLYEWEIDPESTTKRELHDAIIRLAEEHPEEVAEKIAEARGIDTD